MGENGSQDKTLEAYAAFPFMESFPFKEYEITLEKEGVDPTELGISPIVLKALGNFGTEHHFAFSYLDGEHAFSISFHQEDIARLADFAKNIKKMNALVKEFNDGLAERDLLKKVEFVKNSKKFIKSLKLTNLFFVPMEDAFNNILDLHGVKMTPEQRAAIQKLSTAKIEDRLFTESQLDAVLQFLNFQINYAKILLGIIIAVKIH